MARALYLPDILTDAGCRVRTVEGWETRGKDSKFFPFRPAGVLEHHTATSRKLSIVGLLALIVRGRVDLAGPLAQLVPDRTGIIYVVASGIANHAGIGKWNGLSGARVLFGLEGANEGTGEPWPNPQIDVMERSTAAICDYIGADESDVAGHREYATPKGRKIDPVGIDMNQFRARIRERFEEDDMAPIVKLGDVGPDVALWKKALNVVHAKQGWEETYGIKPLEPGTWFSPEMEAMVAFYQEAAGLVDPATKQVNRPGVVRGQLDPYTILLFVEYSREDG